MDWMTDEESKMPIVTLCRSCDTVMMSTLDRCSHCGSKCIDVKYLDGSLIKPGARLVLVRKITPNAHRKAHSSSQKA